jgi:hypothetical protein
MKKAISVKVNGVRRLIWRTAMKAIVGITFLNLLLISPIYAQTSDRDQEPGPGSSMQKLVDALSGRWSISQSNADGTTAQGEEIWRVGAGGVPLVEEYRVTNSKGRELADYAAFWWDNKAKKYRGIWCAHFTDQGCSPFDVRWSGNKIEMNGEYDVAGRRFSWKEGIELIGHDSFTQTLAIGPAGGELKLDGTVRGTRLPGARSSPAKP